VIQTRLSAGRAWYKPGATALGHEVHTRHRAEALERGVIRAVEILSGREMLSVRDFAKFIGVSREAVRGKHQRGEVLGLQR
jgi:hypothetical protein